jgi:outer membrane biosynthesis protein TonB
MHEPPPPPPPPVHSPPVGGPLPTQTQQESPPSASRRPALRFERRGIAGIALGAIGIAAIALLIVLDVGLQSRVNSLQSQVSTAKAGLATASAISSGLTANNLNDQAEIASLEAQVPNQPDFTVVSSSWQKGCSADTCFPEASVVNYGQTGQAVVMFSIDQGGSTTGTVLATCSASITSTAPNGAADVNCPASSAALIQYFENNPAGEVSLQVVIKNP